jgi:hypothetical protein
MFNKTFSTVGMLAIALIINAIVILVALAVYSPEHFGAALRAATLSVFGG